MTKAAALAALNDGKTVTHPQLDEYGFGDSINLNEDSGKTQEECEAEFNNAFKDNVFDNLWNITDAKSNG